ncbi:MAG TPA: YggT family protein [Candidatus Dormibacteraeota bacterium]|jgi:uncharacterized protein YggT (Ycf19 family)
MERRETEVVRDETTGVVREESRVVSTTGGAAPMAEDTTEYVSKVSPGRRAIEVIYLVFGIVDGLLLVRLLLKVLGTNPEAPFSAFIYGLTDFLLGPFKGMLPAYVSGKTIFEPSVLIAILVYALIAWMLAKIVEIVYSRSVVVARRSSARDIRPHSD